MPVDRNDNRNVVLHPPTMTPLALVARLISLLFGLGTMLVSYFLATQLTSKSTLVPIATAAVVGFQPTFLFTATAISNDAAITFFGTLTVAILVYRLRKGHWIYFPALLGAVLGSASITKVSGLFFPLVGLALLFMHRGFRAAFFRDGIVILIVALGVGRWWYGRNALLYHNPLTVYSPFGEGSLSITTPSVRSYYTALFDASARSKWYRPGSRIESAKA